LYCLGSGKRLRRFKGPANAIGAAAFSSDGKRALVRCVPSRADGSALQLWDLEQGRVLRQWGLDDPGPSKALGWPAAFAPTGRFAAATKWPQRQVAQLVVWEVASGQEVRTLEGDFPGGARMVQFNPDGKSLLAADYDGAFVRFEAASGKRV